MPLPTHLIPEDGVDAPSPLWGVSRSDGVDAHVEVPPWTKNSLFPYWLLPKNKNLKDRARWLRKQGIRSEVIFWQAFKDKKKLSWDIDRQVIIWNYIVDFFIPELWLIFEIDGSSHDWREEYDRERDAFLIALWLQVLRILDSDVKNNLEWVKALVHECIRKRVVELGTFTPPPSEAPLKEGNRGTIPLIPRQL